MSENSNPFSALAQHNIDVSAVSAAVTPSPPVESPETRDKRLAASSPEELNAAMTTVGIDQYGSNLDPSNKRPFRPATIDVEAIAAEVQASTSPEIPNEEKPGMIASLRARKVIIFIDYATSHPKFAELPSEVRQTSIIDAVESVKIGDQYLAFEIRSGPARIVVNMVNHLKLFTDMFIKRDASGNIEKIRIKSVFQCTEVFKDGLTAYLFRPFVDPLVGFSYDWLFQSVLKK